MFTADAADGLLGTIELDRVLRMLGIEPNAQELKAVMDEFGQHSGKLNQDDFLDLMERQLMSRKKTEFDVAPEFAQFLRDSFHLYDKDKDGSITKAEIKTIFSLAGESITDDEIDDLFMAGDRNSDGKLDFDEWVALMADMEGAINLSV